MNKRHLLILVLVTLLVRGVLFISYPLGGIDDDESAERYLIGRVVQGDLAIGNMRFNTGYPFFIAPFTALASKVTQQHDRLILLLQVVLSATIPFLVYDMVRRRYTARDALIVALVPALDPFGLQWAHTALPVWMIAVCLVLALWLVNRALLAQQRGLWWSAAAGFILGIATVARWEAAIFAAVLGLSFLGLRALNWRKRLAMFATLGVFSSGFLALYLVTIQLPDTGTLKPSCMSGIDAMVGLQTKKIPISADNGPDTKHILDLMTLPGSQKNIFLSDSYSQWRKTGPWASLAEQQAFFSQPYGTPDKTLNTSIPGSLIYYMGLCPTSDLLMRANFEAINVYPVQWFRGMIEDVFRMMVTTPHGDGVIGGSLYLPTIDSLKLKDAGTGLRGILGKFGFRTAIGDFYTGQLVWIPGVTLFSRLFHVWNLFHWLTPIALIWALLSRRWLYVLSALMLLAFLPAISLFNTVQARVYAPSYPLMDIVIGGLLAAVLTWLLAQRSSRTPIQ